MSSLVVRAADTDAISQERMQAIYKEVKTPFKYGVVLEPPPGKKVDCPTVFRHGDKWYMIYVELEEDPQQGYTTQLAESDDLLHWKPLGTILQRGETPSWDSANAGGGVALFDTQWSGGNQLQQFDGHYWLSYIGGQNYGYEVTPLAIGIASTTDPFKPEIWQKLPAPVLKPDDADVRPLETETLYKSYIFRDEACTLGAPFVMFYNAKPLHGSERIFTALSDDMKTWRRFGTGPALENLPPPDLQRGVISGDPQVVRMDDVWVMFYFGAFWKPGAFNTFAVSRDLVHWTKWDGEDLIKSSEPYDTPYAHKPWVIKHDGVVYQFYCAVGGKDQHRTIALATSKDLKAPAEHPPYSPAELPGKGLAQHPFLYCGEWDTRKPLEQSMFIVRDGKIVWHYFIPMKTERGGIQEFDDVSMLPNGNIVFSRMSGAGIVSPDKKLVWNYDAPVGTEVHSAQWLGDDRVLIMRNGNPAQAMIFNTASNTVEKEIPIPTTIKGTHGQFRHIRMTPAGTILVPHMSEGKVVEYDLDGKEIWSVQAPNAWAAVRLKNGNTLLSGDAKGYVREVNPKGETVWEFTQQDVPDIKLFNIQGASRLANGNTVICNWCANGAKNQAEWPTTVQVLEVTPDKKVEWALRSWEDPADLGTATAIQLLDEPDAP